jgi:hypothetical protein
MFTALPVRFPRVFALMWFNQSKGAEADWALNTSAAAVASWKEGLTSATAIRLQAQSRAPRASRRTGAGMAAGRALDDGRVPLYRLDGVSLR